jgi:hypothetical protein
VDRDIDEALDLLIPTGPAVPETDLREGAMELARQAVTSTGEDPEPPRVAAPAPAAVAPEAPAPAGPVSVRRKRENLYGSPRAKRLVLVLALAALLPVNVVGLAYYAAPMAQRVRSPMHAWLRPSGYLGQSFGIVAFVLFLFLYLYPLRKRVRALAFTGSIARWLDVHIAAGLLMPLLGAMHASWRFQGLVGLGYLSLLVVALSGIVGKYLYVRIPRSRSGLEMSLEEVDRRRRELLRRIVAATGLEASEVESLLDGPKESGTRRGVLGGLLAMVAGDLARARAVRRLKARIRASRGAHRLSRAALREVTRLARREVALTQQRRMLDTTQRIFGYWHVVHRPFSATAFVAVTIHVVVVVTLGVTWFR